MPSWTCGDERKSITAYQKVNKIGEYIIKASRISLATHLRGNIGSGARPRTPIATVGKTEESAIAERLHAERVADNLPATAALGIVSDALCADHVLMLHKDGIVDARGTAQLKRRHIMAKRYAQIEVTRRVGH